MKYAPLAALMLAAAPLAMAPAAFAKDAPAAPVAAPAPTVGATVLDPQGGVVGKIVSVAGTAVVIDTGTNKATIDAASIGAGANGPTIAYTKAQLDAAVAGASQEAAAKLTAALVAGAAVKSQDGVAIGTIKEVTAQGNVVVERPGSKPVALPKDTLMLNAAGEVSLLFTAAQFEAAIGRATARTEAPGATPSS